jgi:hypothetical protein
MDFAAAYERTSDSSGTCMNITCVLAVVTDSYSQFHTPGVAPTVPQLDRDDRRRNLEFDRKSSRCWQAHSWSDDKLVLYQRPGVCAICGIRMYCLVSPADVRARTN